MTRPRRVLAPVVISFVVVLCAAAFRAAVPALSSSGPTALSTFLKSATDRGDVPGVVVAVVDRNGTLYDEGFGLSSTVNATPMTKDTIVSMASMTKPITSVAVMMLVDEGKLKLDDEVAKYLPKYKAPVVISKFDERDASYETRPARRPITIRHLLTHTSGIGYSFSNPMLTRITEKSRVAELDLPLLFDPGERWAYGPSTRVLGDVVEVVSGQTLDAFLETRIFQPLGMRDTSYAVPASKYVRVASVNGREADGRYAERPKPATLPATVRGDGGLYGTASDYGLFLRMLLNHGALDGHRILSEASARTMLENHTGNVVVELQRSAIPSLTKDFPVGVGKDHWGLGFQLAAEHQPNRRSAGSGTWAGIYNTHFFIDPIRSIGVVVMMQTLPFYDDGAMKVCDGVEEIVYSHLQ